MPNACASAQKKVGAEPGELMSKLVNKVSEKVREKVRSDALRSANVVLIGVRHSNEITDEQHVRRIFQRMGKQQQSIVFFRRLGN